MSTSRPSFIVGLVIAALLAVCAWELRGIRHALAPGPTYGELRQGTPEARAALRSRAPLVAVFGSVEVENDKIAVQVQNGDLSAIPVVVQRQ